MEDLIYKIMMTSTVLTLATLAIINICGEWTGVWWNYLITCTFVLSLVLVFASILAIIWI